MSASSTVLLCVVALSLSSAVHAICSPGYSANQKLCGTNSASCATTPACCRAIPGTCYAAANPTAGIGMSCTTPATKYLANPTSQLSLGATQVDFDSTCCANRMKCSDFTASSSNTCTGLLEIDTAAVNTYCTGDAASCGGVATSYTNTGTCCKVKATNQCSSFTGCKIGSSVATADQTTVCTGGVCTEAQCCTTAANTCLAYGGGSSSTNGVNTPYSTAKITGGTALNANCGALSGTTQQYSYNAANGASVATGDDAAKKTACCTTHQQCSNYQCPTGSTANGVVSTTYLKTTTAVSYDQTSTCCTAAATTCHHFRYSAIPQSTCTAGNQYYDSTTFNSATTTAATFNANCCTNQALCSTLSSCTTSGKEVAAGDYCGSPTNTDSSGCTNTGCCTVTPGSCKSQSTITACTGNTYVPESNYGVTSVTATNFQTQCCTTTPFCSNKQCAAGREQITNAATTYYIDVAGSNCCTTKAGTCYATFGVACTTATKYLPAANYGTMSTDEATCCVEQPTCGGTSGYSCNTAISTAKVGTTRCTSGTCDQTTCCTPTPTTCFGATTGYTCPAGYHSIVGYSGAQNAASTVSATNCCLAYAKCSAWWSNVNSAAAVRPALATVVVGAIASFMLL